MRSWNGRQRTRTRNFSSSAKPDRTPDRRRALVVRVHFDLRELFRHGSPPRSLLAGRGLSSAQRETACISPQHDVQSRGSPMQRQKQSWAGSIALFDQRNALSSRAAKRINFRDVARIELGERGHAEQTRQRVASSPAASMRTTPSSPPAPRARPLQRPMPTACAPGRGPLRYQPRMMPASTMISARPQRPPRSRGGPDGTQPVSTGAAVLET